jgi:sulfate transport system substrate-binding protein
LKRIALPFAVVVALVAAGCGGASDTKQSAGAAGAAGKASTTLSLVAYSTPQVVYDEVIPAFEKTAAGEQSRAVEAGLPADVVSFSLEPDLTRLVKAGLVDAGWSKASHNGLVSTSVVTLIVRKGNPKHIRTWDDLLKPGVKVLTPNPFTSGAAKWNLLAAYGAKGIGYVRELLTKHVAVQDKSGREALQSFTSGNGDVLISYENEALTAQKKGQAVDYVTPDKTIKIENPIAATSKAPAQAKAFLDYAQSAPAQQIFASWGYRPVDPGVLQANASKFPTPKGLFTVASLGGWSKLNDSLFDPAKGAIAKIEEAAGVSTAK